MKTPHILIVDDDQKNTKLLNAMLKPENYQTTAVFSGREALDTVDRMPPDLILLDAMMPEINGFEVCREIKQDDRLKIIPVVMVTALKENEHRVHAMEAGADDFLSKPLNRAELLIRVKSLLRIKSYHDELMESYQAIDEKNRQLKTLEKAKDGLFHMIVHDLANPLCAILMTLDLIKTEETALLAGPMEKIDRCIDYTNELDQMIQTLLGVQQMEENKLTIDLQPVKLVSLLGDVLDAFRIRANSKKISLQFCKPSHITSVPLDAKITKRVIANLLSNAIRHTPNDGEVTVHANTVDDKNSIIIRIQDTGSGLDPEYHQKIFNKYEQVAVKRAGISTGSCGLGLAFCKMAVEAHGGRIWVESKGADQGSTFCMTFPADRGAERSDA
jgi:two-component system, sensor histidine kinase and response regulator